MSQLSHNLLGTYLEEQPRPSHRAAGLRNRPVSDRRRFGRRRQIKTGDAVSSLWSFQACGHQGLNCWMSKVRDENREKVGAFFELADRSEK